MSWTPRFIAAGGVGFLGRRALTPVLVVGGAFGSAAWFGIFEIATGVLEFVMPVPEKPDTTGHYMGIATVPPALGVSGFVRTLPIHDGLAVTSLLPHTHPRPGARGRLAGGRARCYRLRPPRSPTSTAGSNMGARSRFVTWVWRVRHRQSWPPSAAGSSSTATTHDACDEAGV